MQKQLGSELERVQDANAFHAQIGSLVAAKIPVCLVSHVDETATASVESLHAKLESHLSGQGTLETYLSDSTLPENYRMAMNDWLRGAKREALERLTAGAEGQRFYGHAVGFVFLQAVIILGAVFFGMVVTCYWLVPKMERIQGDTFVQPGIGMSTLTTLRGGLPYWGPLILFAAMMVLFFHQKIIVWLISRCAPLHPDSYALSEFQSLYSRPARFQWLVSLVVVACGICVLVQAMSVLGVTIEIVTQLVSS